jgi:hypothetical protein
MIMCDRAVLTPCWLGAKKAKKVKRAATTPAVTSDAAVETDDEPVAVERPAKKAKKQPK